MLYWFNFIGMVRIGVDAFGGDNAPEIVVKGAVAAAAEMGSQARIVLYGNRDSICDILRAEGCDESAVDIVHTTEAIEMGDHPVEAFRQKRESSIVLGFADLAEGKIDGFASAGSTGAMLVGSMMVVKPLQGVLRPTIATSVATVSGSYVTILDIGINVDCKPEVLEQYAVIGSVYAAEVLGIENPRVALLNIGSEQSKGNAQIKSTYELMKTAADAGRYNFVGNIEPSHIFTGEDADVVVCDGFVGNTILKLTEGFYAINSAMGFTNSFWQGLNYEQMGGTPVLGVNAVVTVGHGKSTPKAIKNMILSTYRSIATNLICRLKEQFE